MRSLIALALYCLALAPAPVPAAPDDAPKPFAIRVVDDASGRGVPLVELETTNAVVYVTDSAGYVALDEPSLFGRKVFFTVRSHGYEFAQDGFGFRGKAVEVAPGGEATLKIKRLNVAERLYRVTGADIYRDSVLLGRPVPIEKPLLNAQVAGQDSVLTAVYRGKIHWFWGDTNKPAYPLGLFEVPGAVSDLPSEGGLDPEAGVNLAYFEGPDGFARATCDLPGDGPTWCFGLTVLKDQSGRERMFAGAMKVKPPLSVYARSIVEWNDGTDSFEKAVDLDVDNPLRPDGQPFHHTADGVDYVYFATPYPLVRVKATPEAFLDPSAYEAYTCLAQGSTLDDPRLDRGPDGTVRYAWKRGTPPVGPATQKKLVDAGLMKFEESRFALRDRDTGKPITAHTGSVYWNDYRRRWVMICLEVLGSPSNLGEVWYSESDAPEGPWLHARKIVTHDKYDFYNPKQHPVFDKDGGRTIFFEGTYTNTFSGNPVKTPRYDYNQIMYKLDLADPRLAIPVAVRRADDQTLVADRGAASTDRIAFYALDRGVPGTVPVFETAGTLSTDRPAEGSEALPTFHAIPLDRPDAPPATVPLYEFIDAASGKRRYSTDAHPPAASFGSPRPLCRVWPNPIR